MVVMSKCPVHGAFPSRGFSIQGSSHVTLRGNTESCPQCGRPSAVMDGTFNFRDGIVEVLSAPAWTRQMLDEAQAAVRNAADAVARSTSDQEILRALAELRQENAQLTDVVTRSTQGRPKHRIVSALLAIAFVLGTMSDVSGGIETANDVVRFTTGQVAQIVESVQDRLNSDGNEPE